MTVGFNRMLLGEQGGFKLIQRTTRYLSRSKKEGRKVCNCQTETGVHDGGGGEFAW